MKIYTIKRGYKVYLDDKDFDYLIVERGYNYYARKDKKGKIIHVCRYIPALLSGTGKQKNQLIHWDILVHPSKGFVTDHIDGNPLNNQKNNLRICSYRKNGQNKRHITATTKYSSKYSGVCWNKGIEKWMANITINKTSKHLGLFLNEEDAAQAYKNACEKLLMENLR